MLRIKDSRRRISLLLFGLFFLSASYFHHLLAGWNVNSRIALTYAIVERGTFAIDYYQQFNQVRTADIAFYNGHYYSDKIIGTSLLGTIPMCFVSLSERILGREFSWNAKRWLVETFSVKILAALSAVILFRILLLLRASTPAAVLLSIAFFFGTQIFSISMVFLSYGPALFFALLSYFLVLANRENLSARILFLAGLSLGGALLCEYTIGIPAVGLSAYVLFHAKNKSSILLYWVGAALPLSLFLAYTLIVFGRPMIPYDLLAKEEFKTGMSRGFEGIGGFNPSVLYFITLDRYRGLLYHSPFLVLVAAGWVAMWKEPARRSDAVLSMVILAAYLLFNASYYMWWGGFTNGPRHLIPALPFLIYPLVWVWNLGKRARFVLLAAIVVGLFWNTLPAMVDAQLPQGYPSRVLYQPVIGFPYIDPLWELGIKKLPDTVAVNPGFFLGLKGWRSLIPLVFLWLIAGWALVRALRTHSDQEDLSQAGFA